MDLISYY